jgi:general nucleoside transport system ATP-binding protein
VLARELTGDVEVLIVSNPCFGLDFAAVSAIRDRLVEARNRGVAILLISEDLDEIMELSDRIIVMSQGHVAYETPIANGQRGRDRAAYGGARLMPVIDARPFDFAFDRGQPWRLW